MGKDFLHLNEKMKYIIKLGTFILQLIYQCFKFFPVKDKITMISRQSNEPSIDFLMLKKRIVSENNKVEVIFLCHTLDGGVKASVWSKIKYGEHMLVQMYHMATSKVVVLDTYCIVASLLHHRKGLKIVQMWHSMGTMKLFGYTAIGSQEGSSIKMAQYMHMHEKYDYFIAASPNYVSHLSKGFRCDPEKAFICPLPRYDLLKNKKYKENKREEIYKEYPFLKGRKKILYCPTFRKDETSMKKALDRLISSVPEQYELIVKLHPLSKLQLDKAQVCVLDKFSTFEALFVADYVISDYSCVIYEAGVLKLPLCFYVFDLDQYTGKRGFAIPFENEVKGVISSDPKVIMKAIREEKFNMNEIESFISKYIEETDDATGKLTAFLLEIGGIDSE